MANLQIKSEIIASRGGIFKLWTFLSVLVWANSLIRTSARGTRVGTPPEEGALSFHLRSSQVGQVRAQEHSQTVHRSYLLQGRLQSLRSPLAYWLLTRFPIRLGGGFCSYTSTFSVSTHVGTAEMSVKGGWFVSVFILSCARKLAAEFRITMNLYT